MCSNINRHEAHVNKAKKKEKKFECGYDIIFTDDLLIFHGLMSMVSAGDQKVASSF